MSMRRLVVLLPLVLMAALAALFASNLVRPDHDVLASPLIGQPVPQRQVPPLTPRLGTALPLSPARFGDGRPVLVNFFASWCVPCRAEHPQLIRLARAGVKIYGVAVKDRPQDTAGFLRELGDPYAQVFSDARGRATLDWGVSAYPESYLVDGRGIVHSKLTGVITPAEMPAVMAAYQALAAPK